MITITPNVVRALAGQSGFIRFCIKDGNVLRSIVGRWSQEVGQVTDVSKLMQFCAQLGVEIDDQRTPPALQWIEDPWVLYGA
ncbi:MAG: hypothetical protein MUQ10_01840 [Anaerolineae bacterium]|nr:hypothetical protein [Anaerolineae bacterium]